MRTLSQDQFQTTALSRYALNYSPTSVGKISTFVQALCFYADTDIVLEVSHVEGAFDTSAATIQDMGIDHRGSDVFVSE